jgi:YHYH protein
MFPKTKLVQLRLIWSIVTLLGLIAFAVSTTLPLGDGKISDVPQKGYVFACPLPPPGPGAHRVGEWIQGDTWLPEQKIAVAGLVEWPTASVLVELEQDQRIIRANNLPDHPTGIFPIEASDPAYQYDRNPNTIREQNVILTLPATPESVATPSCLPLGMVGFALSGAAIYHAVDLQRRDAPAYEIQDSCNGHPEMRGQYHYHDYSPCLKDNAAEGQHSDLVGYALDGFGIYGLHGEDGALLTNDDLDECHGHTHTLLWNGETTDMYHYHFTSEYPYSLSCFKGTPTFVN